MKKIKLLCDKKVVYRLTMTECSVCGKEIDEKMALKLTMNRKTEYFCHESCLSDFHPIRRLSRRTLSNVVLNKSSAVIVAIGMGMGGIARAGTQSLRFLCRTRKLYENRINIRTEQRGDQSVSTKLRSPPRLGIEC